MFSLLHTRSTTRSRALLFTLWLFHPQAFVADTRTTTQTLTMYIQPDADVSVPASAQLTRSGAAFGQYTGSLTVDYWARTTLTSGSGQITVKAAAEFTPTGGPTVSSGAFSFTCGSATLGTACTGSQTVSASAAKTLVAIPAGACTGGGGQCSSASPNTVNLNFILENQTAYKTGNYTIQLTFNVSSL